MTAPRDPETVSAVDPPGVSVIPPGVVDETPPGQQIAPPGVEGSRPLSTSGGVLPDRQTQIVEAIARASVGELSLVDAGALLRNVGELVDVVDAALAVVDAWLTRGLPVEAPAPDVAVHDRVADLVAALTRAGFLG